MGSYGEALSQASIVSRYLCCRVVTSIYVAFEDCDFLVEDFFVRTSFYGSPWSHSLYASTYHKKGFALSPVLKVRVFELENDLYYGWDKPKAHDELDIRNPREIPQLRIQVCRGISQTANWRV